MSLRRVTCSPGKIFNPITERCILATSPAGKRIDRSLYTALPILKSCPEEDEVFDPVSGRCIKDDTQFGRIIRAIIHHGESGGGEFYCSENKIFNPDSEMCVKVSGAVGRAMLGVNNCYVYPERDPNRIFTPTPAQVAIRDYFINELLPNPDLRGLLLFWGLGSGKTCTSAICIDAYLNTMGPEVVEQITYPSIPGLPTPPSREIRRPRRIYIITPGSLRENYLSEYCRFCGIDRDRVSQHFYFVTYNYSRAIEYAKFPSVRDLEDSLIVIDEFHNVSRGYLNGGPVMTPLVERLLQTQRSRFLLLTGTPVVGKVEELYITSKFLRPSAFSSLEEFQSYFNLRIPGVPRPYPDFYEKLYGVISYNYPQYTDPSEFPRAYEIPVYAIMSEGQYDEYFPIRQEERKARPPSPSLKYRDPERYTDLSTFYFMSTTMVRSRQRCNMLYPDINDIHTLVNAGQATREKAPADHLVEDVRTRSGKIGWIPRSFLLDRDNLLYYMPKFLQILRIIDRVPGKHVVYSEFKARYGVYMIDALLRTYRIRTLMFTGDQDDRKRRWVLEQFNGADNIDGSKFRVLLITDAGAEGQSFLEVRGLHIVEQYVNSFAIQQVKGRVIRLRSHIRLPPDQRTVNVYYYFAVTPGPAVKTQPGPQTFAERVLTDVPPERWTSDYESYFRAVSSEIGLGPTLETLQCYPLVPSVENFEESFNACYPPQALEEAERERQMETGIEEEE